LHVSPFPSPTRIEPVPVNNFAYIMNSKIEMKAQSPRSKVKGELIQWDQMEIRLMLEAV
jgi:hypothetical protein